MTISTSSGLSGASISWSGGALTDFTGITYVAPSPTNAGANITVFNFSDSITFGSGLTIALGNPVASGTTANTNALAFDVLGNITISTTFNGVGGAASNNPVRVGGGAFLGGGRGGNARNSDSAPGPTGIGAGSYPGSAGGGDGGGGGGHIGVGGTGRDFAGGSSPGAGGIAYDDTTNPFLYGGSGGAAGNKTGSESTGRYGGGGGGGGALGFYATGDITVTGSILATGGNNGSGSPGGGGGSGGSIILDGTNVNITGATLNAAGDTSGDSGGGGGGLVYIRYSGTYTGATPGSPTTTGISNLNNGTIIDPIVGTMSANKTIGGTSGGVNVNAGTSAGAGPFATAGAFVLMQEAAAAAPNIVVSPNTITLASIITGGSAASQNITVTEDGGAAGNYNITGPSGNFSVVGAPSLNTAITANNANTHAVNYANTTTVGTASGSVSFAGNSPTTGSGTVALSGDILDHASGSVSTNTLTIPDAIVGYSTSVGSTNSLTYINAAGHRVNLKTTGSLTTGNTSISASASGVTPGGSSGAVTGSLAPGQAVGSYDNNVAQTYADDSALSGFSTNLGTENIHVTGTVLDHSDAEFVSNTGTNSLDLDFGTLLADSGIYDLQYFIENLVATFRAALDLDTINEASDPSAAYTTNATTFDDLAAGGVSAEFDVFIDTTGLAPGTHTASYTFALSDEDGLSGSLGGQTLTLNVTAEIEVLAVATPEPSAFVLALFGLACFGMSRRRR